MLPRFRLGLLLGLLAFAPALLAGPTDTAIVAAMKLPEAQSYTWVSYIDDDARSYEIHGKTDRSDYSVVTMPMIAAMRRRIGRGSANSDNQVEAVFKGAEKCVVQTATGWKTPGEITEESRNDRSRSSTYPGSGSGGSGFPGGGFPGGSSRRSSSNRGGEPRPYSNLQVNLSRPAEEIGVIVGSYTELKMDGDVVTGTLSETGAKLLLVHPGQDELTPLKASGTFRLWVRDGALAKYEIKLDGTLSVETPSARREVMVHQKSTTELKDVNATKLEVPEEAKKKLGG